MSPPQQLYAPADDVNLYKSPDEMVKLLQKQQEALKNDMMRKRSLMEKALQQQVQVSPVTSQTCTIQERLSAQMFDFRTCIIATCSC